MLVDACCVAQVSSLHAGGGHLGNPGKGAWLLLLLIHVLCVQQRSICSVLAAHFEGTLNSNFREQDPHACMSLGPCNGLVC